MKEGHPPEPDHESAITWILEQMQIYGLSIEDLQTQGYFDAPSPPPPAAPVGPVYMSADGWRRDGSGGTPDWLQHAVNAGQSIKHFRVS